MMFVKATKDVVNCSGWLFPDVLSSLFKGIDQAIGTAGLCYFKEPQRRLVMVHSAIAAYPVTSYCSCG